MVKFRALAAGLAFLAAAAAVTAAQAFYDQYGNVIYIYVMPDGTLVY